MKIQSSPILFISALIFALIGVVSNFMENPTVFLKKLSVMILIGLTIYFIFRVFYNPSSKKKEKVIILSAAKKRKRKVKLDHPTKNLSLTKLTSIKKKSTTHLTVIKGKNNKKKHRASS